MGEWEPVKGDRTVWQDPPTPEKCLKCLRNVWQDPPTPEREKKGGVDGPSQVPQLP